MKIDDLITETGIGYSDGWSQFSNAGQEAFKKDNLTALMFGRAGTNVVRMALSAQPNNQ